MIGSYKTICKTYNDKQLNWCVLAEQGMGHFKLNSHN